MHRPTVKLLITDLDNTLYDWVGFFAKAFRAMVDEAVELLEVDREKLLDELQQVHRLHHDSERAWSLAETASALGRWPNEDMQGRIQKLDPAFHAFNRARKRHLRLYPGVEATLRALRDGGVPIIGHTEASAVNALGRVARLGLDVFFDRLYTTATDAGHAASLSSVSVFLVPREIHKPDPRVLVEICRDYGVEPGSAVYVGDSISRDVGMARQIGMQAVWAAYGTDHAADDWQTLTRVTHWDDEDVARAAAARERFGDIEPDARIGNFAELLQKYEFRGAGHPDALTRSA